MLRKKFRIPNARSTLKCSEMKHSIYCSSIKTAKKIGLNFKILARKEAGSKVSSGIPFHATAENHKCMKEKQR